MSALTKRQDQSLPHSRNDTATTVVPFEHKLVRDGRTIKQYARWVLVIDEEGNILSTIDRSHKGYLVNSIAVLGPALVKGTLMPETVLLEIGLSRCRPYRRSERGNRDVVVSSREVIPKRLRAACISHKQLAAIWPTVWPMLEEFVGQTRAGWKETSRVASVVKTPAGLMDCEKGGMCHGLAT